jgi:hypothetical protein
VFGRWEKDGWKKDEKNVRVEFVRPVERVGLTAGKEKSAVPYQNNPEFDVRDAIESNEANIFARN